MTSKVYVTRRPPRRIYPKESIVSREKSILKRSRILRPVVGKNRIATTLPVKATYHQVTPTSQNTKANTEMNRNVQNDPSVEETEKKHQKKSLKFSRHPIKVLIIESRGEYCNTVWFAIGAGFALVAIGAVNILVLQYSILTSNNHISICCFGFHFFSAEAILCLHYANGWSTPMRLKHRKLAHALLNTFGVSLALAGTIMANMKYSNGIEISYTIHGATGYVAALLALMSAVTGLPTILYGRRRMCLVASHTFFGLTCFLLSSISLLAILFIDKNFSQIVSPEVTYVMTGLLIFYTVFIFLSSFSKCISRIT